jgi:UDP-3-O-[3-hydroxymyristoyl] glucosamine N-acyltransferase
MQLTSSVPVTWLAEFTGAKLIGNHDLEATGINEIHKVRAGDVSFVDTEKYYDKCLQSPATIILINQEVAVPDGKVLLVCPDPFSAYVKLVKHFSPFVPSREMIDKDTVIGAGTLIQPNVFIGPNVQIGKDCLIHPNVTIYGPAIIGDRVIIHAGTVIGADAFYFKKRTEREVMYDKLESCGRVVIHDEAEVGAGCTIDRGVSGDTVIGKGTKLDNQVHIGHGAVIGANCLFAAQVGIGGKAIIEDDVTLWGQVGVSKDLVIGSGAVVLAQSGIPSSLKGGKVYFGYPAEEAGIKRRELVWIKRIPELWEKVKNL